MRPLNSISLNTTKCRLLLICIFSFFFCNHLWAQKDTSYFYLSSGMETGAFHEAGEFIVSQLNKAVPGSRFLNIQSEGSPHNLERLRNGEADFCITQCDKLVEEYYKSREPLRDIEIIAPLFQEAIQIFIKGERRVYSFSELQGIINSAKANSIYIGNPKSASYENITRLFYLLDIHFDDSILIKTSSLEEAKKNFKGHDIKVLGMSTAIPSPLVAGSDSVGIVSFSEEEIKKILGHMSYLERISIPAEKYPLPSGTDSIRTLVTWSFLIGRSSSVAAVKALAHKNFIDVLFGDSLFKLSRYINGSYTNNNYLVLKQDHGRINFELKKTKRVEDLTKGMPMCSDLGSAFGVNNFHLLFFLLLFAGLIIPLLFFLRKKRIEKIILIKRTTPYVIAFAGLVLVGIIIFKIIFISEQAYYIKYGVKSSLLDLSFRDRVIWNLRIIFDPYSEFSPISDVGKILVSTSHLLGYSYLATTFVYFYFKKLKDKKKMEGKAQVSWQRHHIICGWNSRSPELIRLLIEGSLDDEYKSKLKNRIVIIFKGIEKIIQENSLLKGYFDCGNLLYIDGDAKEFDKLKLSNIAKAHSVILVAEDSSKEADDRTLLKALAISKYGTSELKDHNFTENIYMIAELNDSKFTDLLKYYGVNEVICQNRIINNLIMQSSINHGLLKVLEDLLTFDSKENNEFYSIDLSGKEYATLIGRTYDDLMTELRSFYQIQLVAILKKEDNVTRHSDNGNKRPFRFFRNGYKNIHTETKGFILNPVTVEDKSYRTCAGDHLLVIAMDASTLKLRTKKPAAVHHKVLAETVA